MAEYKIKIYKECESCKGTSWKNGRQCHKCEGGLSWEMVTLEVFNNHVTDAVFAADDRLADVNKNG